MRSQPWCPAKRAAGLSTSQHTKNWSPQGRRLQAAAAGERRRRRRTSAILSSMNLTIGFRRDALSTICCACSALVPCQTALPSAGSCGALAGGCCGCCCGCCSCCAAMLRGGLLEPWAGRPRGCRTVQRAEDRDKQAERKWKRHANGQQPASPVGFRLRPWHGGAAPSGREGTERAEWSRPAPCLGLKERRQLA